MSTLHGRYINNLGRVLYYPSLGGGKTGEAVEPQEGDRIGNVSPTIKEDLDSRGFYLDYGNGNLPMSSAWVSMAATLKKSPPPDDSWSHEFVRFLETR